MNGLLMHQLQNIYYAEKQLVKALPATAEKAAGRRAPDVRAAFLFA
jgi:ferritin-like metal-binding protein YciE